MKGQIFDSSKTESPTRKDVYARADPVQDFMKKVRR